MLSQIITEFTSEFTQYLTHCQFNDQTIQYFTQIIEHSPHLINNNFNPDDLVTHLIKNLDEVDQNIFTAYFTQFFHISKTYQDIVNTYRPHLFKQRLIEYHIQNQNQEKYNDNDDNNENNENNEKQYILFDADEISTHKFKALSNLHAFYIYCEQFSPHFYEICAENTSLPLHTLNQPLKEYINQQIDFITNQNSPEFFIQIH